MQIEVKDTLADMKVLSETLSSVKFFMSDDTFVENRMPSIGRWDGGRVELVSSRGNIAGVLKKYGVNAEFIAASDGQPARVSFMCHATDDIVALLNASLSIKRLQAKAKQYDGLAKDVDQLVQHESVMKPGVFGQGVNAVKNQIKVLKSAIEKNKREM